MQERPDTALKVGDIIKRYRTRGPRAVVTRVNDDGSFEFTNMIKGRLSKGGAYFNMNRGVDRIWPTFGTYEGDDL